VGAAIVGIIYLAVLVLMIASAWKIFVKANEPGWAAIIPIYNIVVMLKICGKPIWWLVLFLIPGVSIVAGILVAISFAKSFGKGTGFALGLIFLGFIFAPMLAFSDATYQGPAG
jgi:hypothetical protein